MTCQNGVAPSAPAQQKEPIACNREMASALPAR
jgi:hypothetical protein